MARLAQEADLMRQRVAAAHNLLKADELGELAQAEELAGAEPLRNLGRLGKSLWRRPGEGKMGKMPRFGDGKPRDGKGMRSAKAWRPGGS